MKCVVCGKECERDNKFMKCDEHIMVQFINRKYGFRRVYQGEYKNDRT